MVSLLLVAIAMVSSNETGLNEQSLNRLARAANGGKGKYSLLGTLYSILSYLNIYFFILKHDINIITKKPRKKYLCLFQMLLYLLLYL